MRQFLSVCLVAAMITGPIWTPVASAATVKTATPIKHIVIIFGENRSFDHYFGTYPNALNPAGEPHFSRASGYTDRERLEQCAPEQQSQSQSSEWQRRG